MTRRVLLFLAACIFLAGGCRVHEVPTDGGPDGGSVVELTLKLNLDKALSLYQEIPFETKAEEYEARYVVALFRYASETPNTKPDYVFLFTEPEMQDRSYMVEVAPMNYKVVAWVDYVKGGEAFYTSPLLAGAMESESSFQEVTLVPGSYTGNSPWRDAFYGAQDVKLASYLTNRSQHEMEVTLARPNAHFNFVATDRDQFIENIASKGSNHFDVSDFSVKVTYPQFLPCTYNLFTDKPVDSRTGVSFDVEPTLLEDGNVEVGSDWVFANADKTTVIVSLSFYDAKGQYISSLNNIEVPLCQGKNTTIKGALLTNGVSSGISIDPSFDGEIIINF